MSDEVRFTNDGGWTRWRDGVCVAEGGAAAAVALERGDAIVAVDCADWPTPLRWVQPSEALAAHLDEMVDEGYFDMCLQEDADPILTGNDVFGASWGWMRTLGDEDGASWRLVPAVFATHARQVIAFNAWQSESMTGAVIDRVCACHDGVMVASVRDDIDGLQLLIATYGSDPAVLAANAANQAFKTAWPACPCCDPAGWEVSLSVDFSLGPNVVRHVCGLVWEPCGEHRSCEIDLDGRALRWRDGGWVEA